MIEVIGNLWDEHLKGEWICVTTNGFVKRNGLAVMGAGIALQCVKKYPEMPAMLGTLIQNGGNHVHAFTQHRIFSFPTKHRWWEMSDAALISRSMRELEVFVAGIKLSRVFLPRPGCSNGKLNWSDVRPLLTGYDDRFVVMDIRPVVRTEEGKDA